MNLSSACQGEPLPCNIRLGSNSDTTFPFDESQALERKVQKRRGKGNVCDDVSFDLHQFAAGISVRILRILRIRTGCRNAPARGAL